MTPLRWAVHPILVLIFSILALMSSLFLYIYWYMEASIGLRTMMQRFNLDSDQVLSVHAWLVILVLSLLVGIIILGMFTIFVYNHKTMQLYRLQRNFINAFTHELKTPATSLNLYLETFRKHDLGRGERLKYLDYMLSDVKRLSDSISHILNLARIESKSYRKDLEWGNLVAVLETWIGANLARFPNCAITLDNPTRQQFPCRINPYLFDILLMNLIVNAFRYNDTAAPRVDIRLMPRKRRLQIRFRDNGIGFDSGEREKIFKKFYRVGRSDDMTAKGSGLGLYMAQSIARIHKGKIAAESDGPGTGAVFTLSLPLAKDWR